jgi:V8-like Glu-specific endopeptidase
MCEISVRDRNRLIDIFAKIPKLNNRQGLETILGRSEGLESIVPMVNLEGTSDVMLFNVIKHLENYGRISYDRCAIGVFLSTVKDMNLVGLEEKNFINNMIKEYNLMTPTARAPGTPSEKKPSVEEGKSFLEKIIGENTLRPIAFLMRAIEVSRSVCYVGVPSGSGTGFLIGKNKVITNNHVISDKSQLSDSFIRLNYQIGIDGKPEEYEDYKLNANGIFATNEDLDYTIVETDGNPGEKWGYLKLFGKTVSDGCRVNIVQHPGGGPKQISLQNNFVEYVDDRLAQYLTSTLPGSSGSPVFDNNWRVVALHHAGGNVKEPQTGMEYYRNEGITIPAILQNLPSSVKDSLH